MNSMKLFNSEKDYFFKIVSGEFNFKGFSRLILIRISIEVQLIDSCHLIISDKDREN